MIPRRRRFLAILVSLFAFMSLAGRSTHAAVSCPGLGNIFTVNRAQLRECINNRGTLNFDRLYVTSETQTRYHFPGYFLHWDYETNSSFSCYQKNWDVHLYENDCPGLGKMSSCPQIGNKTYLSGVDWFKHLCSGACTLYHEMTGIDCEDIVDQLSTGIGSIYYEGGGRSRTNGWTQSEPYSELKLVTGDPVWRKITQGAIDGLNDLLPYARVSDCSLSKVSPLNIRRTRDEIQGMYDCIQREICNADASRASAAASLDAAQYEMRWKCNAYKNNKPSDYKMAWSNVKYGCCKYESPSFGSCKNECNDYFNERIGDTNNSINYYKGRINDLRNKANDYINQQPSKCSSANSHYSSYQSDMNSYNDCMGQTGKTYNDCKGWLSSANSHWSSYSSDNSWCNNAYTWAANNRSDANYYENTTIPNLENRRAEYERKKERVNNSAYFYSDYKYYWYHSHYSYRTGNYGTCYDTYYYNNVENAYVCSCPSYYYTGNNTLDEQRRTECVTQCEDTLYKACRRATDNVPNAAYYYKHNRDIATNSNDNSRFRDDTRNYEYNCYNYNLYRSSYNHLYRGYELNNDGYPQTWRILWNELNTRCWKSSKSSVDNAWEADYYKNKLSLPAYRSAYIVPQVALLNKRLNYYERTVNDPAFQYVWRANLCPSWDTSSISYSNNPNDSRRGCMVVNLFPGCVNQTNDIMRSGGSDVTHKSEGTITTYSDRHACTGDNDAANVGRCYKYTCYPTRETCRGINPFFVETSELCTVGNLGSYGRLVYNQGPNNNRTCRNCVGFSTCTEANRLGFRLDTVNNVAVPGYFVDDKNSERYLTIRGECTTGSVCKPIYYPAGTFVRNCDVGTDDSLICQSFGLRTTPGCSGSPIVQWVTTSAGNKVKCYTGGCTDSCRAHGYFRLQDTNCASEDSCVNNESTCSDQLKLKNFKWGTSCYTTQCRSLTAPPSNGDGDCYAYGYYPNNWTCGIYEQPVGGNYANNKVQVTYGYSSTGAEQKMWCSKGCKLKSPSQINETCDALHLNTNETTGGTIYYHDNTETRYETLANWIIGKKERIVTYTDSLGHTHPYRTADDGYYSPETRQTVQVCRFDRCGANDAAYVASIMQQTYNNSECARGNWNYYMRETGALYDSCDHVYTFDRCIRKVNSCAPTCTNDTDMGFGTYRASGNTCEYYASRTRTSEDRCKTVDGEDVTGGPSTGTTYFSTRACRVPTCPSGFTLSINSNKVMKPDDVAGRTNAAKCGKEVDLDCHHKITINGRVYDKVCYGQGGVYQCRYATPSRDTSSSSCTIGDTQCYSLQGCEIEYNADGSQKSDSLHPVEFGAPNANNYAVCGDDTDYRCRAENDFIFIPVGLAGVYPSYPATNQSYKAGVNGKRCGRYIHTSSVRWTVGNASNVYTSASDSSPADFANDGRCAGSNTVLTLNNTAFKPSDVGMNYEYFQENIDTARLPDCLGSVSPDANGFYTCKISRGNTTVSSSQLGDLIKADRNLIVFIDDAQTNFLINTNIITDEGYFKAFIAKGKITVGRNVGKLPADAYNDHHGCSSITTADLQGFFGAASFEFEHGRVVARSELSPFNDIDHLYCDRQLVFAGSIAQWNTAGFSLGRSFKGCVGGKEDIAAWNAVMANPKLYPDYNAYMSPFVFYPRPDFDKSAPDWMKSQQQERTETN